MNQISVKLFDVESFNLTYNFSTEVNSTSPNKGALINFHETLNWKVKPLDGLSHQADKYRILLLADTFRFFCYLFIQYECPILYSCICPVVYLHRYIRNSITTIQRLYIVASSYITLETTTNYENNKHKKTIKKKKPEMFAFLKQTIEVQKT